MEKELTPKQQISEAVRQAENILIVTGQYPTADQVASAIGLGMILRKFGKKVSTVISDDIPPSVRFLPQATVERNLGGLRDFIMRVDLKQAEVDKLKYTLENGKLNVYITPFSGAFKPGDVSFDYGDYHFDLVLVLGVPAHSRIDRAYTDHATQFNNIPLINIDFHRSNEQYGAVNLIDGYAASLGEILVALSESLQTGLVDAEIATVMLTGIMAATDRFTATHTTSKALTVAAQMMAAGADQQKVVRGLYKARDTRPELRPAPRNESSGRSQANSSASQVSQPRDVVASLSRPAPQVSPTPSSGATPPPVEARPAPVESAAPALTPTLIVQPAPAVHPQPGKSIITSGRLEGGKNPSQVVDSKPAPTPKPAVEPAMEELLPPQHIEMSEYNYQGEGQSGVHPAQTLLADDAEPLINYTEPTDLMPPPQQAAVPAPKGVNPANISVFG